MKTCPTCGHELQVSETECPHCGSFKTKLAVLIAEQEEDEEKQTFRGRCKRILNSGHIKNGVRVELKEIWSGLSKKGLFTIYFYGVCLCFGVFGIAAFKALPGYVICNHFFRSCTTWF